MASEGVGTALKRAFTWHWHLLGLGSAVGFALLTGPAAVAWVPILAAAEIGYLGFLGLNPRFQNVLRGKEITKAAPKPDANSQLKRLLDFLVPEDRERFQQLQNRCVDLLDLRRRMDAKSGNDGSENFRGESLDRLLWLFLKLLHQRSGLERFLATTNRASMEWELSGANEQLKKATEKDKANGGIDSRLTNSIKERITAIQGRLDNYDKANENREVLAADLDKTEQQITHLCEVGMTMSDSEGLSAQIDGISESLKTSETAFRHPDLEGILNDEAPPPLLSGNRPMLVE